MSVWFTSDLHFGHEKVATLRGYDHPLGHDVAICDRWRAQVHPKDQVWVLGDLALSNPANALSLLASLPGEKHLIWGNHDQGHPMYRDAHRKAGKYLEVFTSAQAFARRRVDGRDVLLSHFPYDGDTDGREADRHTAFRLRDEDLPLIHGHTHSAATVTQSWLGTQQIHVGWDARHRLVHLDEIAELLR